MKANVSVSVVFLVVLAAVLATGCDPDRINQFDYPTIIFNTPDNGGWGNSAVDLIVPKIKDENFVDNLCTTTTVYSADGRSWQNQPLTMANDGDIDFLGVCSDSTSWNPIDPVSYPSWTSFCKDENGLARVTAIIPISGHFRGNIFAVNERETSDGQRCWEVAYLDLSQWQAKYGHNNEIIRPDGQGGQIIDFWTTAEGNGGEGEGEGEGGAPVVEGVYSNLVNGIAHAGQRVELTVNVVGGSEPMSYQWQDNDVNVANNVYNDNTANNQKLVIVSAGEINTGWYACIVTNAAGSVKSAAFHLTILPAGGEGEGEGEGETVEYGLSTAVQGSGTVSPSGGHYRGGSTVNLSAVPASGWRFSYWTGDLSGTQNPAPVLMNGDKSVTAVFTQNTGGKFVLATLIEGGEGEVFANVVGPEYNPGTVVQLTAATEPGYVFDHWSGDLSGNANPAKITMDANKNVTAVLRHTAPGDVPTIPLEGQPNSIIRAIGERAEFTVIFTGEEPCTVVWLCNGVPIALSDNPTAHNATLVIISVGEMNYAGYSCEITNAYGSVTSAVATLWSPAVAGFAQLQASYDGASASLTASPDGSDLSALFFNFNAAVLGACNILRVYNYPEWHAGNKSADFVEITWSQLLSLPSAAGKWKIVSPEKAAKSEWVIIDEMTVPSGGWQFPVSVPLTNWLADPNNPEKRMRINLAFVESNGTEHYANTGQWRLFANGTLIQPTMSCLDYTFRPAP